MRIKKIIYKNRKWNTFLKKNEKINVIKCVCFSRLLYEIIHTITMLNGACVHDAKDAWSLFWLCMVDCRGLLGLP